MRLGAFIWCLVGVAGGGISFDMGSPSTAVFFLGLAAVWALDDLIGALREKRT